MNRQEEVLEQLRTIIDPDLGKDIVTLGFIKDLAIDGGDVSFRVELTTPACPVKETFRTQCEQNVSRLPWVDKVSVEMSAQKRKNPLEAKSPGLEKVSHIVAVSSCKGGVGKSTVAVNLAAAMQKAGARVGIFDADIYGPSIPTLLSPPDTELYQVNNLIQPLDFEGMKVMSFGYVPRGDQGDGPAILRGPMVTQIVNQLLTGTDWGELDYLIIDFPPGTGDVQLTLTQIIPITAAVIVTTPQQLSFIDVVKGIQMFDKLKVPTISVVENMSIFQPEPDGPVYRPFGRGAGRRLAEQFGFQDPAEIPIRPELTESCDRGVPLVLDDPDSPVSKAFEDLAEKVVREVSIVVHGADHRPRVTYSPERGIVLSVPGDENEYVLDPVEVRLLCRGAHSVDEFTGERKIKREDIPADIHPRAITPMGHYAVSIEWSHGHPPSIYPYEILLEAAGIEENPIRSAT